MQITDKHHITEAIKQKAKALGSIKVGIAPAVKLSGRFLTEWISQQYHGTMEWMARTAETRLNPAKFFPEVKSIIVMAFNYYNPDHSRPAGSVQISRYAVPGMRDYHLVLREKLSVLLTYIQELVPDAEGLIAVDDAPVADKIWAAYAGIGWIGKNTNLILREFGSYIFLGELLVNRELEYDTPMSDYCGTCRQCLDACPTGALHDNKMLESTRCISYRTIEHRGEFPDEWLKTYTDWIFGCDVCQEVCPWNSFARQTELDEFKLKRYSRFLTVQDIKSLSKEEFYQRFNDSPIKRCKWEGFVRNAQNALRTQ